MNESSILFNISELQRRSLKILEERSVKSLIYVIG